MSNGNFSKSRKALKAGVSDISPLLLRRGKVHRPPELATIEVPTPELTKHRKLLDKMEKIFPDYELKPLAI